MIKVLIVDDSALDRKILAWQFNHAADIEVVGMASDPYEARQEIAKLEPDVIILDILMPRMDGLSFLGKLMKHYPVPVVMVSSITPENSNLALTALRKGAIEVICKPDSPNSLKNLRGKLVKAVRVASTVTFDGKSNLIAGSPNRTDRSDGGVENHVFINADDKIIAIGASTGGTRALEMVLKALPNNIPGIVIVQHMPPVFTKSFSERLNTVCTVDVKEAENGDRIRPGQVLLAPGDYHLLIEKKSDTYYARVEQDLPVHHHRPSVDVLFNSVAEAAGDNAMGVILTGMGSDGADGLLAMKKEGAHTIGQDKATSVVYGMPKVAYEIGAVTETLPLQTIADAIVARAKEKAA